MSLSLAPLSFKLYICKGGIEAPAKNKISIRVQTKENRGDIEIPGNLHGRIKQVIPDAGKWTQLH